MPKPKNDEGVRAGAPQNFAVDARQAWNAGLHISSSAITAVLTEPDNGQGIDGRTLSWQVNDMQIPKVVRAVAGMTELLRHDLPRDASLDLSVAVAGHVDAAGRVVTASSDLRHEDQKWERVDLAQLIEAATGARTRVMNDANALAVQDAMFGSGYGVENFVSVFITDYGIGSGIVANGQLITGASGSAGEIGHLRVNASREPCRCGGHGCLERVASMSAIRARIYNLGEQDPDSSWDVDVLAMAGQALGSALIALVNLVNPALIIVHGPAELVEISSDETESVFINAVKDGVCSRSAFSDAGLQCRLVSHPFSPEYLAAGAVTYSRLYGTA